MKNLTKQPRHSHQIYLDCNATTPVLPEAADAAWRAMAIDFGNPSSLHVTGLRSRSEMEKTRRLAAQILNTRPDAITFTSGATESIQMAVFSALQFWKKNPKCPKHPKILYGATEHKAVIESLSHWVKVLDLPFEVIPIPVRSDGQIRIDEMQNYLRDCVLLCTMAVNNETGVIQDLDAIEKLLVTQGCRATWLVDSVQALGKVDLDFNSSRIDFATFSGHKIYAPQGVGFLYSRKKEMLQPLSVGGSQEAGYRAGTQNLPGVIGLGVVLSHFLKGVKNSPFQTQSQLTKYRGRIVKTLRVAFPSLVLNTPLDQSVPTTINFSVPGLRSNELLNVFDAAGMRVSAGSACTAGSANPSHVLVAMGLPESRTSSAIRLSFGPLTQAAEVDLVCSRILECSNALAAAHLLTPSVKRQKGKNGGVSLTQFREKSSNTWVLMHPTTRECVVIDPVESFVDRFNLQVRNQGLKLLAILDTHDHADHQSARIELQSRLKNSWVNAQVSHDSLGWPVGNQRQVQVRLKSGQTVEAMVLGQSQGEQTVLAKFPTPGHTSDSVTYLLGTVSARKSLQVKFAFSGDLLLSGGIGRTDFKDSSTVDLFRSLRQLQGNIEKSTFICPAHDYDNSFATTFEKEISGNVLLREILKNQDQSMDQTLIEEKKRRDMELLVQNQSNDSMLCGVTSSQKHNLEAPVSISISDLKKFIGKTRSQALLVIDVREPYEYWICKQWKNLGLKSRPKNIPASQLVQFLSETIQSKTRAPKVLLICRSGNRSLQATVALRRLGLKTVWNLESGIVLNGPLVAR